MQFSLGFLFAVTTALAFFLSMGAWIGWGPLIGCLYFANMGCLAIAATWLPVLGVVFRRSSKGEAAMRVVVLVVGTCLAIHFAATVYFIRSALSDPWCMGIDPFDNMFLITLNFIEPLAVAGLLAGVASGKRVWRTPCFLVGATLILGVTIASVWYGYWLFDMFLSESLADYVWWL